MQGSIDLHLDAAVPIMCCILLCHLRVSLKRGLPRPLFLDYPVTPFLPLDRPCLNVANVV
jgi:hypothetical protein